MRRALLCTLLIARAAGCDEGADESRIPEPIRSVGSNGVVAGAERGPAASAVESASEGGNAGSGPARPVPGFDCIEVVPLGAVPKASLRAVEQGLADTYGVDVRMHEVVPLPPEAYYPPRKRYRAEKLLVTLADMQEKDCDRILGVTTKDISTTKDEFEDWGILGLATMGCRPDQDCGRAAAVISTFRTKKKLRHVSADERLARVAIHELGHTLGLPHCPTAGCLLSDAGGTVSTTDHERELCELCLDRIGWQGDPPPPRTP